MSVAEIVQFHVPSADVGTTSPSGVLAAIPNQVEAKGAELEPDLPPGPVMVKVAVPPDSSVIVALTFDSQNVTVAAPKVARWQATFGPSRFEIVGG